MQLIALDWGTSSLRGWLIDADGRVQARRQSPHGIMKLPEGGFPAAFASITEGWGGDLPAIACGMVGSAQGWREVGYVPCPTGERALAASLDRAGPIAIVPGLRSGDPNFDVMRGEETQLVGGLAARPELAERALVLLPGTHCKWARIEQSRIVSFSTAMTGELFAVLREHSILGRPFRDAACPQAEEDEQHAAFAQGLAAARTATEGVAPLLFGVRALVLAGRLSPATSMDYLSGLLIGDELRAGLRPWRDTDRPAMALIGEPALCARYTLALQTFGIDDVPVIADAALDGLRRIAALAGLTGPATAPPSRNTTP